MHASLRSIIMQPDCRESSQTGHLPLCCHLWHKTIQLVTLHRGPINQDKALQDPALLKSLGNIEPRIASRLQMIIDVLEESAHGSLILSTVLRILSAISRCVFTGFSFYFNLLSKVTIGARSKCNIARDLIDPSRTPNLWTRVSQMVSFYKDFPRLCPAFVRILVFEVWWDYPSGGLDDYGRRENVRSDL